jgi:hypothetical protein
MIFPNTKILNSKHNKSNFNCSNKQLENYLRMQANQDMKKKLSVCYVLDDEKNNILGYYTLSNSSVISNTLLNLHFKNLPHSYNTLPVTLLGRLAIDHNSIGLGYGKFLLLDALSKAYKVSLQLGSIAVIVDPIDNLAVEFYNKMFLAMETIAKLNL